MIHSSKFQILCGNFEWRPELYKEINYLCLSWLCHWGAADPRRTCCTTALGRWGGWEPPGDHEWMCELWLSALMTEHKCKTCTIYFACSGARTHTHTLIHSFSHMLIALLWLQTTCIHSYVLCTCCWCCCCLCFLLLLFFSLFVYVQVFLMVFLPGFLTEVIGCFLFGTTDVAASCLVSSCFSMSSLSISFYCGLVSLSFSLLSLFILCNFFKKQEGFLKRFFCTGLEAEILKEIPIFDTFQHLL